MNMTGIIGLGLIFTLICSGCQSTRPPATGHTSPVAAKSEPKVESPRKTSENQPSLAGKSDVGPPPYRPCTRGDIIGEWVQQEVRHNLPTSDPAEENWISPYQVHIFKADGLTRHLITTEPIDEFALTLANSPMQDRFSINDNGLIVVEKDNHPPLGMLCTYMTQTHQDQHGSTAIQKGDILLTIRWGEENEYTLVRQFRKN